VLVFHYLASCTKFFSGCQCFVICGETGFDVSEDEDGTLFKSRVVQGAEFGSPSEASFCESECHIC